MKDVVDVVACRGEGAGQIADHAGGTAAVVAQIKDDGIGLTNEGQGGIGRAACAVVRVVEVDVRKLAQFDQADIAGQDFNPAKAIVGQGNWIHRPRRAGTGSAPHGRARRIRLSDAGRVKYHVEVSIAGPQATRQGCGEIAPVRQAVKGAAGRIGLKRIGNPVRGTWIEVEVTDALSDGFGCGAGRAGLGRRSLNQAEAGNCDSQAKHHDTHRWVLR